MVLGITKFCFDEEIQLKKYHLKKLDVGNLKPRKVTEYPYYADEYLELRNTLTALAIRHYKRVEKFIAASITKTFPQ